MATKKITLARHAGYPIRSKSKPKPKPKPKPEVLPVQEKPDTVEQLKAENQRLRVALQAFADEGSIAARLVLEGKA